MNVTILFKNLVNFKDHYGGDNFQFSIDSNGNE